VVRVRRRQVPAHGKRTVTVTAHIVRGSIVRVVPQRVDNTRPLTVPTTTIIMTTRSTWLCRSRMACRSHSS
jgi:hypothetical protein